MEKLCRKQNILVTNSYIARKKLRKVKVYDFGRIMEDSISHAHKEKIKLKYHPKVNMQTFV
jgi:hypothetical protein